MGNVVIAHHREEGVLYLVQLIGPTIFVFIVGVIITGFSLKISLLLWRQGHRLQSVEEIHFLVILLGIQFLVGLNGPLKVDVVFSLGVGNIAQMGIEDIVVVESVLQHLRHTAPVVRHVAVGTHEEGIFVTSIRGIDPLKIGLMLLEIEVRHLHTVLHTRTRNEYADGTHLFARGKQESEK